MNLWIVPNWWATSIYSGFLSNLCKNWNLHDSAFAINFVVLSSGLNVRSLWTIYSTNKIFWVSCKIYVFLGVWDANYAAKQNNLWDN